MTLPEALSEHPYHNNEALFNTIADNLATSGYCIIPNGLPIDLASELAEQGRQLNSEQFNHAGIGREQLHGVNQFVRTDEICWINGDSLAGQRWLDWTEQLRVHLNRQLFLGLFSFESHYACYRSGDFYKRHYDAFKGEANRVVSIVTYLNQGWQNQDGGQLVLYKNDQDRTGIKVMPNLATVVVFLSEEFPHEVLSANRERLSIAGWFRVNSSTNDRVDPPR